MWTPKRVLILLGAFCAIFAVYLGYAQVLGGIDGLTPLPEEYWPAAGNRPLPPFVATANAADQKLQMAFGEACEELQRMIKLELRGRTMVLAVNDILTAEDHSGRIELKEFSLAVFGKSRGPTGVPEINTIKSKRAFLTFDKPVSNLTEMTGSSRRIVAAELQEDIQVTNNRRTLQRDDDLHMHTAGPMYYDEKLHRIFTSKEVALTDFQGKPEPTRVTARGMDIYLATDAAKPGAPHRPDNVSGVERVELRSNVRMDLFVDSRSGFLDSGKPGAKAPPPRAEAPADKAKVVITTAGTFSYDVQKDLARFEIPHWHSSLPEAVEVKRLNGQGKIDQLYSDMLELQFSRKPAGEPRVPGDDRSVNLEIQTAHATGGHVTLASDMESLHALGNDLVYDARTRTTVLKGDPEMTALKEGSEIYARELQLQSTEQHGTQSATAKGPGHIRLLDKNNGQRTIDATWGDELIYKKDGAYDCLTLSGGASFEDREHHQNLRAERMRVWLEPARDDPAAPPTSPASAAEAPQRLRPHRLEASGRVSAESTEMRIKEPTESLAVWFRDEAPAPASPAGASPLSNGAATAPVTGPASAPAPAGDAPASKPIVPGLPAPGSASPDKPKPPIELCARSVVVHVVRQGAHNDVEQLACDGGVHVHQDPASPDDRGVDIQGETLQLQHHADGGVLAVTGSPNGPGQVQFDKLAVLGPEVNIDQRENKAWVNGPGAMRMLTDTNFEGAKLAQPSELTVHWRERMYFNGKLAEFHGGVQAEQQNSRLLCRDMEVAFDRPISLKESDKGKPKARVDKMVCDQSVMVEEVTREGNRLTNYRRLSAPELAFDNEDGIATVSGPGELRVLAPSDSGPTLPGAPAKPGAPPAKGAVPPARPGIAKGQPPAPEMKLTHVKYQDRMQANNKTRTATFYGNVQVVNVPCDRPDAVIDIDHPPPGYIYLQCERLKVYSHLLPGGQKSQEMEAHKKVTVQSEQFYGSADVVKYDEAQDRVILEGAEGGKAILWRVKTAGADQETVSGKKIYFWRKTSTYKVENADTIDVRN